MVLDSTVAPPLFFSTATEPTAAESSRDTPPLLEFIVKVPTSKACSTVTPAVFDVNDTAPAKLLPLQEDVPFPMIRGSFAETAVSDPARFVLHTSSVTPLLKLTVPSDYRSLCFEGTAGLDGDRTDLDATGRDEDRLTVRHDERADVVTDRGRARHGQGAGHERERVVHRRERSYGAGDRIAPGGAAGGGHRRAGRLTRHSRSGQRLPVDEPRDRGGQSRYSSSQGLRLVIGSDGQDSWSDGHGSPTRS